MLARAPGNRVHRHPTKTAYGPFPTALSLLPAARCLPPALFSAIDRNLTRLYTSPLTDHKLPVWFESSWAECPARELETGAHCYGELSCEL